MTDINQLIATTFATADADARLAQADAEFLAVFVALSADEKARRWRGLDHGAKFRLIARRIEQLGKSWMPSDVEAQIAKYDDRYALGPVDAAVEGALERLALDNSQAAQQAESKEDRAHFRRAATAFTNALIQYRNGVRPDVLSSRAQLLPSRRPGEAPHLVTLDGDWMCSCKAGASMHWPIALVIGIEVAMDDLARFDGACDPPNEPSPLGGDEGDELPGYGAATLRHSGLPNPLARVQAHERTLGQRLAAARSVVWGLAA